MDQVNASGSAPSGALKRAFVRSALLVAAAGAFVALSAGVASAADGEPTGTTTSQSDTSTTSAGSTETQESGQTGEAEQSPSPEPEPAVQDESEPASEPDSQPESQPAPAEEPQPAPAPEPAPAEQEPTGSEPAPEESSAAPQEPADEGTQSPSGTAGQDESDEPETPVQTGDSGSSKVLDQLVRRTARRAGTTGVADGVETTLQRSSARATDLLEHGALPDLADVESMTAPLRSLVEDRLTDGLPLPGPLGSERGVSSPAVDPAGPTRTADADRPSTRHVVRRDDLLPAGAGGIGSIPQADWTSALDARSGDSDAEAPREGPASPDPVPGALGDVLATSTPGAGGFDLATATRLLGEAVVRAGALALDSRSEGVLLADPAGHPGFSPD